MAEDGKEPITILCPLCDEKHSYTLRVTRSQTIGFIFAKSDRTEKPRQKKILRLFTCPTKNQDFQVTLSLQEWPDSPIKSVEVEK